MASSLKYVPASKGISRDQLTSLITFLDSMAGKRILVLTGAGVSTESGVPDYRSHEVGLYARTNHRPIQYAEFLKSEQVRRRYWARNFSAWAGFSSIKPNIVHQSLASWESENKLHWLITQNVDNLHLAAGSRRVVELHGSAHRVHCLSCTFTTSRHQFQDQLRHHNPDWEVKSDKMAPDADVELSAHEVENFKMPSCPECNGIIKPDIIFFGDNLPSGRRETVLKLVDESDALMCIGTSLQVFSGYRLAAANSKANKPLVIINIGPTRADPIAHLKIEARAGEIFHRLLQTNIS